MASMGSQARAAVFGVLATVLLIATVCVLDEPTSVTSKEANQEDSATYGNGYLEGLAKKLDEKDSVRRKGEDDMNSVDSMLHSFTSAHDNKELGQALKRSLQKTEHEAQRKGDVDLPMPSFDRNGYPRVHTQFVALPKPKKAESDSNSDELSPAMFNDEEMLLQESSSEDDQTNEDLSEQLWTPKGQSGLQQRLDTLAEQKDKKQEQYIEDSIPGFKGAARGELPSEGPITEDFAAPLSKDPFEMEFIQDWNPRGQEMKVPKESDYQEGFQDDDDDNAESVIHEDRDAQAENDIMSSVKTALVNSDVERGVESLNMQDFGLELMQQEATAGTAVGSGVSPVKVTIARKNAATLKAYASLVADKVIDMALPDKKGVLGYLLVHMAEKSKLSPAKQYEAVMAEMKGNFTEGLPQYITDNIATAMSKPAGLLVMGPISGKSGNFVHVDGKYLGLTDPFQLVMRLSVTTHAFISQLSKIDAVVAGERMKMADKIKAELTVKDFNDLFVPVCVGKSAPSASCAKLTQAACGASKSCKWRPAWDGSEVFAIMDAHITV